MEKLKLAHFFLLLSFFVCPKLYAYDISVRNSNGATIYYNWINNNTELEVTYRYDWTESSAPKSYYGTVDIPESVIYNGSTYPVTSIGRIAFRYCLDLTKVTIPNSVRTIEQYAFYNCSSLTSIIIPNSVTTIGWYAFSGCGLTSIIIPNSVTTIGGGAFDNCVNLTSITISNSVTTIGGFYNCTSLTNITIPNSVTTIGGGAFRGCSSLTSITMPNSVTTIGNLAFEGCRSLANITLNSVTTIGDYAFQGCRSLTSITLNSVTTLGNGAFQDCDRLTSITIPTSLTNINGGYSIFEGCPLLESINVLITDYFAFCNSQIADNIAGIIRKAIRLVDEEGHEIKEFVIPEGVTEIGYRAFTKCDGLTSITIPSSVTRIGIEAFIDCDGLTSVTIPNSVISIGDKAFQLCDGLTNVTIPNSLKDKGILMFADCNNLTNATIHCDTIPSNCFLRCGKLKEVTIGNEVTTIGYCAFERCFGLRSVTIPNSVKSIMTFAFLNSGLLSIEIPNSVTNIDRGAFGYCNLRSVVIGSGVSYLHEDAFTNRIVKVIWLPNTPPSNYRELISDIHYVPNDQYSWKNQKIYPFLSSMFEVDGLKYVPVNPSERTCDVIDCAYDESAEKLSIGNSVSYRGVNMTVKKVHPYVGSGNPCIKEIDLFFEGDLEMAAFELCDSIKNVTLGNHITSIGNRAFYGCSSLQSIIIPDAVKSLGDYAFEGCKSLSNVQFGNNVESIGKYAFNECKVLQKTIEIPSSVTFVGDYAFKGCMNLTNISMAAHKNDDIELTLGARLFDDCPLDSMYIGRRMRYSANSDPKYSPFHYNKSLRAVTITDKETEIITGEFEGCSNLKNIKFGNDIKKIGDWAFSGCNSLESFSFGPNVESIGEEAFSDCTSITKMSSLALTPPVCGSHALDDINKWNCTLSVPKGCIPAYQQADQWKDFFFINDDASSIKSVTTAVSKPASIYNLNGHEQEKMQHGINLIKMKDGTTKKVLKK